MVIRRQQILALTVALVALLAVVGFASAVAAENDALEPLTIETGAGAHTVMVEIADTPEERGVGLMHRTELPSDRGMLFDFRATRQVTMWMKNTLIPLDMFFAGERRPHRHHRRADDAAFGEADTLRPAGPLRAGDGGRQR